MALGSPPQGDQPCRRNVPLFAAVALAGGLMALGLLWLEREATGDEASDARVSRALNADRGRVDRHSSASVSVAQPGELADDSDEAERRPPSDVQAALGVLARREPPPKDSNAPCRFAARG